MNANATPRQSRPPHRLAFARATGIVLAAMLPRLAAAATLPEPALRLSPALAAPAADVAPEERALLRVEYRAAQTRESEADAVGDILARVRHMNGMIRDVHGLIEALPQARPATASATATTAQAATPRPAPLPPDDDAAPSADSSLVMRALMASVIVFLFWLLGKRHNYIRTQRRRAAAAAPDAAATPTIIPDDALVVELPPPAPVVITAFEPPRQFKPVEPVAARPAPMAAAPDARVALTFDTLAIPGPAAMPAGAPPHGPAIDPGTDQSLELAEIMVSMGLAHGAAEALTERIRDNPKRALYHWLKLLDVYRRSEMKEEFERAAQDLRQSFNVQPEGWEAKSGGGISIEDYPHLAAKLLQLWPTPECEAFLAGLLKDNRGGTRHGFPQSVAEEILLLEKMLDVEAPTAPA